MTTIDTLEAINTRYSCRAFRDTPVPDAILRQVAEAGLRAPSAVNRQPWRIVVVTDRSVLDEIDRAGLAALSAADPAGHARVLARGGGLLYGAPALVIIAGEPLTTPYPVATDVGIVASHIVLAATALGLNSCVAAMPGAAFQGEAGPALRARLLPEGFDFALSVMLGYATAPGGTPHAPDPAKLIFI